MTVLLIDPHKHDRDYSIARLHSSSPDYVVLETNTGKGGLSICRSQQIDCVVTELTLPDMSGFEVLTELVPLASRPEMPVIVLTRLLLNPMASLAMNNGAQAYLVKSQCSGDELAIAIQKAIGVVSANKRSH